MVYKQINVRLRGDVVDYAEAYAKRFGFKNVQELIAEALREKIFYRNYFDESFTSKEIELIDGLVEASAAKGLIRTEKELMKALE
ncbi:MAG: hypothetical protein KAW41_00410 [Candidatus Diapherotrites archaeon]|nr:hypothetical protein [Candidatus Diapherotrites archaeon]